VEHNIINNINGYYSLHYKLGCIMLTFFTLFSFSFKNIDNERSKDFNIKKYSSVLKDEERIEYKIDYSKETLINAENPFIEDNIDKDLTVTNISYPLPTSYKLDKENYYGTPIKNDYKDINQLTWKLPDWSINEEKRLRFNQTFPTFNYSYNSSFRTDLLYFPSSKIYKKVSLKDLHLGNVSPILEIVENDVRLFVGTLDGRLLCLNPKSGYIYWEHKFPLGEVINAPFASFRQKSNSKSEAYIVVLTELGKLYSFDCLDGSINWSKQLSDKPIQTESIIKVLEQQDKTLISIICDNVLYILDSKKGEEILNFKLQNNASSTIFFPFKNSFSIILSSKEGNVSCISNEGKTLWSRNLDGEIDFDGTLAIFDGIPYLLFATSSKALYILNGLTGEVLNTFTLPGEPRSIISFDPEMLSYFLLTSLNTKQSEKSVLFGGSLLIDKPDAANKTKIEVDGKYFIGPTGIRIKDETILYFINEYGELYAMQKGAKNPVKGFPIQIVARNEISSLQPFKGYIASTECTLFITSNNFGFLIIGSPFSISKKSYLNSSNYIASEDLSFDSVNLSGGRFRNDLDSIPESRITFKKPVNLAPHDNSGHIITPTTFFDTVRGEVLIAQTSTNGFFSVLNLKGEEIYSINPKIGPIYTEPIITFNEKGNKTIYIVGSNGVVAFDYLSNKEKWRREDLGSFGSSFAIIKSELSNNLIFVDKYYYLTSLNAKTGETLFREKVDSKDYAISEIDGEKIIFCGSKMVKAVNGSVLMSSLNKGSSSTAVGINGKCLLMQSDDLDMLCIDPKSGDVIWRVRKLWCKKYCFDYQSPAVLRKGSWGLSIWSDYSRIVCVEISSGLIRWSFNTPSDYFVSKPTIVETSEGFFVFAGSINGKVYAFNCLTGEPLPSYPIELPGKSLNEEVLKGVSSPVVINGLLLVNRVEYGLIGLGFIKETNRLNISLIFKVKEVEEEKGKVIFNQAIIYWNDKYKRSNIVKN